MVKCVQGLSFDEVNEIIESFTRAIVLPNGQRGANAGPWRDIDLPEGRLLCVVTPWEVLRGALKLGGALNDAESATQHGALSCDACVVANRIRWVSKKQQVLKKVSCKTSSKSETDKNSSSRKNWYRAHLSNWFQNAGKLKFQVYRIFQVFQHSESSLFHDDLIWLQKFGKVVLSESDEKALQDFVASAGEREVIQLKYLRLLGLIGYHCRRLGFKCISAHLASILTEMEMRGILHHQAIADVDMLFKRHGINAIPIKGLVTRALYPETNVRNFSDFDYLTSDFNNAVKLAFILINNGGYEFPLSDSIPFSLKIVLDEQGNELLTGHFHLKKYIGRRYVEVDVNFPGIPLGLLNTMHYPESFSEGCLPFEEQFVIALAHLFKHDVGYMKDINDLYLMLKDPKCLELGKTMILLQKYSLEFAAKLIVRFLNRDFNLDSNHSPVVRTLFNGTGTIDSIIVNYLLKKGWPYRIKPHLFAQAWDIMQRRARHYGWKRSILDIERLLLKQSLSTDHPGVNRRTPERQKSIFEEVLNLPLFTRLYLLPLVVFRKLVFLEDSQRGALKNSGLEAERIPGTDCFVLKGLSLRIIFTPLGLFLPSRDWKEQASRETVERTVWSFVDTVVSNREVAVPVRSVNI
jgi:hypothetical protein